MPDSTTRWRDEPVIPEDYEDVRALVKIARDARKKVVEFDWGFGREDLDRLRQGVYEWGSRVRGAYRCFDARVLAAINDALGDTASVFVLKEPSSDGGLDCQISCVPDGDGFRLRGHAPFDIVFGYGEAGVRDSAPGWACLSPSVRATLAGSVEMLGWDLKRLQEARFGPVRNALYGLPVGHTKDDVPPHPGPELQVTVEFQGPFSAVDDTDCPCLFTDPVAERGGVYLWTISVDGDERPWYVGQTRRGFGQRLGEHVASMLSGKYAPVDPDALSRGENRLADGGFTPDWPRTLPLLLRDGQTLIQDILATIRLLRFHVAPLTGDRHLHDRVEGAIGRHFKTHPVPEIRGFITPGLQLPAAIPGDQPMRLELSSEAPIAGLPPEILEPSAPLAEEVRQFVESTPWTFAKTYAETWPHDYVTRTPENAPMLLALAKHIFEHGVAGRFYSQVRRYHHEGGKVYWSMDPTPEATDLVNRCDATQTYESRLAAGTLPKG